MKRQERHHLKENELAASLRTARDAAERYRRQITFGTIVVLVIVASVVGFMVWRGRTVGQASERLAQAMAVLQAPVAPAPPPGGKAPASTPPPGSHPTERAKLEAALPKFLAAADAYPSTKPGIAARFHAAGVLARLGRHADAIKRYQEVTDRDRGGIYGQAARLGIAEAQMATKQYEPAIATYRELAAQAQGRLPVDAILMQLGRACAGAGKTAEARQAFNRLIQEFPESPYAADAKKELDALKA